VREARAEGRAEGHADARAEAEAAAEQRLAAVDQARRKEREAAVREALALGARQVSACPARLLPLACGACAPYKHSGHATKQPPSMPAASRHGLRRGCACCTLIEAPETLIRIASGAAAPMWHQLLTCCLCLCQGIEAATKAAEARLRAELEAQARAAAAARAEAEQAARERDALRVSGAVQPGAQHGASAAPARSGGRHGAARVWVPAERGHSVSARRPPPFRALLGAQRALRRRRSMPARTRCGPEWRPEWTSRQACHSAHRRQGRASDGGRTPPCSCLDAGDFSGATAAVMHARGAEHPCDGQGGQRMRLGPAPATGEARRQHNRVRHRRPWRMRCACAREGARLWQLTGRHARPATFCMRL